VAFEITEAPNAPELVGAHAVIWTTTPWTIPVNQALAYGADVAYTILNFEDSRIIISPTLIPSFLDRAEKHLGRKPRWSQSWFAPDVEWKLGKECLANAIAEHPMADKFPDSDFYTKPRPFLDGSSFVTTEAGTGLVHMAPDHGEDDFDLCKANGINPVFAVDAGGQYREDWAWLPQTSSVINKKFVSAEGPICANLRDAGALLSAQ